MSEIGRVDRGPPKGAAERMRLYRERRQHGLRYVRIPLHVTEIENLRRMGCLPREQRQDEEAIGRAVSSLIEQAVHDRGDFLGD
jgi:hypothetical protein